MAEQALLGMVQDTCRILGLTVPTVVIGSTDLTVLQMLALLNEEVYQHTNGTFNFPRLKNTLAPFNYSTNASFQAYDLTTLAGYRSVVPRTFWNRTTRLPVYGPVTDEDWAAMIAMGVSSAVDSYRVLGNWILIYPGHAAVNTYAFDWMTSYGVLSAAATPKEAFTVDTDTPVMPSRILKMGLKWRWKEAKKQGYAQDFEDYQRMLDEEANRESIPGDLTMDTCRDERVAGPGLLIAAGSWNV